MAITRINFQSIPVDDQDRAIAFYTENLGFKVHTDAPYSDGWRWIFLELPGAETRLQFAARSDMEVHGKPALCLVCDSVDDEAAKLRDAGVHITDGPDDAPWAPGVRWLMIKDSEGNLVLLESFKS
ncbi:VOC family protein [Aliiroseovarius sp. YM-037]|uniref:VOC family protein n=1 Tax=Aliiroseovarius sp. YM-037 TaxID=3341728 RepID=UPI003A7F7FFC